MLSIAESRSSTTQFAPANVSPDDPVEVAVRFVLADGVHWFRVNDVKAREGDVEGVHHLRTTTRRLRSALSLFRKLLDPDWSDTIKTELKWLADLLGGVRDLDVMTDRIRKSADEAGESEATEPLIAALDARRGQAAQALSTALQSDRYQRLAEAIALESIVFRDDDALAEPCRSALPRLVANSWDALKRRGRALSPSDPDEDFHDVRKRAKKARYAAEAVTRALDPDVARDAEAFAKKVKGVQEVLGLHQDAVVAAEEIRTAAVLEGDCRFSFAAGRLYEREQTAANSARSEFFHCWDALDHKKLRRWLKP
jgi:CHAD domain-containing protein